MTVRGTYDYVVEPTSTATLRWPGRDGMFFTNISAPVGILPVTTLLSTGLRPFISSIAVLGSYTGGPSKPDVGLVYNAKAGINLGFRGTYGIEMWASKANSSAPGVLWELRNQTGRPLYSIPLDERADYAGPRADRSAEIATIMTRLNQGLLGVAVFPGEYSTTGGSQGGAPVVKEPDSFTATGLKLRVRYDIYDSTVDVDNEYVDTSLATAFTPPSRVR